MHYPKIIYTGENNEGTKKGNGLSYLIVNSAEEEKEKIKSGWSLSEKEAKAKFVKKRAQKKDVK